MEQNKLSLSVIVPAYNEAFLIETSIKRLMILKKSNYLSGVQVIVIDDCSTDGTADILNNIATDMKSSQKDNFFEWIFLKHESNEGKGKAIQTALSHVTGDICICHDSDLEYNPGDILKMIPLFIEDHADAVYGSRFMSATFKNSLKTHHKIGNKILTFLCNLATNINLTDMETCYKAVRTSLLKSIPIESNDFSIEPELTIKLAKRGIKVMEVPISYTGRSYHEGKKINWKDGIKALIAIVKFRFFDKIPMEKEVNFI